MGTMPVPGPIIMIGLVVCKRLSFVGRGEWYECEFCTVCKT